MVAKKFEDRIILNVGMERADFEKLKARAFEDRLPMSVLILACLRKENII